MINEHLVTIRHVRRAAATGISTPRAVPFVASPTDDPSVVRVPLFGKHGDGFYMTLDASEWPRVQEEWGSVWVLIPNGNGRNYVSAHLRHLDTVDQPGSGDTARLGRLLVGARRGEVVIFQDGDTLNLRRSNLLLLDQEAARKWRREQTFAPGRAALH